MPTPVAETEELEKHQYARLVAMSSFGPGGDSGGDLVLHVPRTGFFRCGV